MKKLIISLGIVALILAGGFMWLLIQADADRAPQEEVIVDLTDRIKD